MSTLGRLLVVAAASMLIGPTASAQPAAPATETAAVLDVVDRFMRAISSNDVAALAALRLDGALNIVESPDGSGGTRVTRRPFNASSYQSGTYLERYWDPIVHIRGSLAVVWTPYEFLRDGKTSHCGIDSFEMVKQQGQWRIGNIMWTVEPDGCERLRPTDPATMRPRP
jgi:hypothetical protein